MNKPISSICIATILFWLSYAQLQGQSCSLNCNDHVHASVLSNSCERTFQADDFLENPDITCQAYTLNLVYPFGTTPLAGNNVDRSHLGYTFVYQVQSGSNSCWGFITIEDKAPPQPFCKSDTISCFQYSRIEELTDEIIDNCGEDGKSVIEKLTWTDFACDSVGITGRVTRRIRTIDTWGNSVVCTDTLSIRKDSFPLIKCPDMIVLDCIMSCKKANNTGSQNDPKNHELFVFSSNPKDANYPSPEKLIELQKRDTFGNSLKKCINANLKVVPYIRDSVVKLQNGVCVLVDTCISMYQTSSALCKMLVSYSDLVFPLCGTGFKLRREWRFTNWCTGTDTLCIQYISVEDKVAPIVKTFFTIPTTFFGINYDIIVPGYRINAVANIHDCYAPVCIDSVKTEDCSKVTQQYTVTYSDPTKPGSAFVKNGNPRECFSLPASPNNYLVSNAIPDIILPEYLKDFTMPRNCYAVRIQAQDPCYNNANNPILVKIRGTEQVVSVVQTTFAAVALVCITDETPPNPVCDEITQTTIDPDKCWSRIYAADLDNGSRDNCCDVLHFAVAQMDTVAHYRAKFAKQMEDSCGKAAYWKDKSKYDLIIENWINCYVFKEYIDLTECKENQVILRVYEACGIPRLDDHIFTCGSHAWFCYNTYPTYFLWHNYQFKNNLNILCESRFPWSCIGKYDQLINSLLADPKNLYEPVYEGATNLIPFASLDIVFLCFPEYFHSGLATSINQSTQAPGNTCSKRLYSDCMIRILIDDKTPPVAEDPRDKFWYCDNVSSNVGDQYEYAKCNDDSYTTDNGTDHTCVDGLGVAYHQIESKVENDSESKDTIDPTGKFYGWYGCNVYGGSHPDEHGIMVPCPSSEKSWAPLYCRSWLILDSSDAAGKVNPLNAFDTPVLRSGNPGSISPAAVGTFYIWDNCWIDLTSLKSADVSFFDKCGNGWIKRTWDAKDKCGNFVTVDQKITTKHRSDFEVLFPADKVSLCGNQEDISPEAIGRPIVMDDECELVGINYEDQKFDIVPDACYKILRTWRIVDWCKFDPNQHDRAQDIIVDDRNVADVVKRPCVYRHVKDNGDGFITYIQIILVRDTIAPVVTTRDTTVCIFSNDCSLPTVSIPFKATDNCTATNFLSYRWELDEKPDAADLLAKRYNKSSIDKQSANVTALSIVHKQGTSLVHVIAEDNCGNEDTSTFVLTVKDCKKPTPYCYNGVATVIMPSTGSVKIWASDLNAGSTDNCTAKENLRFGFGPNRGDSCRLLDCKDIPNGISFTLEVDIYVWDEAGNNDFCRTYISVQDGSGNICEDSKSIQGSISGVIMTQQNQTVEHVLVEGKSSAYIPSYKTNNTGQYAFLNLPLNGNYAIKPRRNDLASNGVSTIDLLKIQKHIMGLDPIQDPYTLIAADINNDKEINTTDLIELRKLVLNVIETFPTNASWKFVPKKYTFDPSRPFDAPDHLEIKALTIDALNSDFVGIKIGDVNHTVTAHSLSGTESRNSGQNLYFMIKDQSLLPGEVTEIVFHSPNFNTIETFQFTIAHPGLEILDIVNLGLGIDQRNFGSFGQTLTTSWENTSCKTFDPESPLFKIKVRAKKSLKLSEQLIINSRMTKTESFNGVSIMGVGLQFDHQSPSVTDRYELYQNTPNPFKISTNVYFELAQSEAVQLRITDIMGKVILYHKVTGHKGTNQWAIDASTLGSSGIYYYSIETDHFKTSKKMILLH